MEKQSEQKLCVSLKGTTLFLGHLNPTKYAKVMAKTVLSTCARECKTGNSGSVLKYPVQNIRLTSEAHAFWSLEKSSEVEISGSSLNFRFKISGWGRIVQIQIQIEHVSVRARLDHLDGVK